MRARGLLHQAPHPHHLAELAQTHVHGVSDAIQASHPRLPPSPPAFSLSQQQGLFLLESTQDVEGPPIQDFLSAVLEARLLQFYQRTGRTAVGCKRRFTPSRTPQDLDNFLQTESDIDAHQEGSPTLLSLHIKGVPVTLGVSRQLEGKDPSLRKNLRKKSLCGLERKNVIRLEMRLSSPTIYVRSSIFPDHLFNPRGGSEVSSQLQTQGENIPKSPCKAPPAPRGFLGGG